MRVPLSWLKDFVDIDLPLEDLAHLITMAGLEVEEIRYVGLPMAGESAEDWTSSHTRRQETKLTGIEWDPQKIVVAEIREVMPHPNADRLVLCRLYDGEQEHTVLTGAPNLFPFTGQGSLNPTLKVAYAREGATLYDGHQPGEVKTTLKRAKIRGVESYSMVCSEKELGISEEHEGVITLDDSAPVGVPLATYMGDAVLDIAITPNIARDANIVGVAREIAALTNRPLHGPPVDAHQAGPPIQGRVSIQIDEPELNPRFVLGLIEDIEIRPSPYEIQRRLRLAGMRPINNIVDATNYAMLELGEPLHAFDYDVLVQRAGGKAPTIITRRARPGDKLRTLDDVERELDDFTVLVCDTAGPLSIGGVMGGEESEVNPGTHNVLLEGAAWNFINVRRTITAQKMISEAAYRFSRGVHPAVAERGVRRGLELMRLWSGGVVSEGLVDEYPLPPEDPLVEVTEGDVRRWLGIELSGEEIAGLLRRLEFGVEVEGDKVRAKTPDHRLDIGEGVIGVADLMEELARIYGYERIPETRMADPLPIQAGNTSLEKEDRVRELLVALGLQEVITYRMTSPENEARLYLEGARPAGDYVRILNPIVSERVVMRRSQLASLMDVVERNARIRKRQALFEIGPVFLPRPGERLPEEPARLSLVLTGPRELPGWQGADSAPMDFFDLKGVIDELLENLRVKEVGYEPDEHPTFHPGKCARLIIAGQEAGYLGEIHPLVRENYDLPETAILAADFDLETITAQISERYDLQPVPAYPPVLEDLAILVYESIPAAEVERVIRLAGGETVVEVNLFDLFRGPQIGAGKKSLAYSLTYQDPERTLTDQEVSQIRERIISRLEAELGAKIRRGEALAD